MTKQVSYRRGNFSQPGNSNVVQDTPAILHVMLILLVMRTITQPVKMYLIMSYVAVEELSKV